jgi:hypothetical protein
MDCFKIYVAVQWCGAEVENVIEADGTWMNVAVTVSMYPPGIGLITSLHLFFFLFTALFPLRFIFSSLSLSLSLPRFLLHFSLFVFSTVLCEKVTDEGEEIFILLLSLNLLNLLSL